MRLIDADVLNDTVEKSIAKFGEVFSEDLITGLKACVYIAMQQPTIAQPEIIHCRECKYWMPYDWMFSEVWKSKNMEDYPENEIGCMYADMSMSATDFCSRAERLEGSE